MVRTGLALLFSSLCISLPGGDVAVCGTASQQAPVNPLAQAMVEFKKRVDAYLELRQARSRSKYPEVKETGDPAKIHEREKALGKGIAMARANAKAGDVFGPEMSRHLLNDPGRGRLEFAQRRRSQGDLRGDPAGSAC